MPTNSTPFIGSSKLLDTIQGPEPGNEQEMLLGAFLLVHESMAVGRSSLESLTPPLAMGMPAILLGFYLRNTTTSYPQPIDTVSPLPAPDPWWHDLLGVVNPALLTGRLLAVGGVALARREWNWLGFTLAGIVVLAAMRTLYLQREIPVMNVVGSFAVVAISSVIPFVGSWAFARPVSAGSSDGS